MNWQEFREDIVWWYSVAIVLGLIVGCALLTGLEQ
jgi:hypothetical protein